MPLYRCPITGQNGHMKAGSFFEWARVYFGEFHTYEDNDLVPVPSHYIWKKSGKPKTHKKFVEWCAGQLDIATQSWLDVHIEQGKVPGVKAIVDRVRKENKIEIPEDIGKAVEEQIKNEEKKALEANTGNFLGQQVSPEKVKEVLAKLSELREKKLEKKSREKKIQEAIKNARKNSAKKAAKTRSKKKAQMEELESKRSNAAKKAWKTRRDRVKK